MNDDDAERLTRRVLNACRTAGPADEWRRVLRPHDLEHATRSLDRCIDESPATMTIRRYLDEYAARDPNRYRRRGPEYTGPSVSLADVLDDLAARAAVGEDVDAELAVWRRVRAAAVDAAIARHPSRQRLELELDA